MANTKSQFTKSPSKLKRRLIGGCWVKHREDGFWRWCIKSRSLNKETHEYEWNGGLTHHNGRAYSGYHKTLVSIVGFEDYGDVTSLGKYLGYHKHRATRSIGNNVDYFGRLLEGLLVGGIFGCLFALLFSNMSVC